MTSVSPLYGPVSSVTSPAMRLPDRGGSVYFSPSHHHDRFRTSDPKSRAYSNRAIHSRGIGGSDIVMSPSPRRLPRLPQPPDQLVNNYYPEGITPPRNIPYAPHQYNITNTLYPGYSDERPVSRSRSNRQRTINFVDHNQYDEKRCLSNLPCSDEAHVTFTDRHPYPYDRDKNANRSRSVSINDNKGIKSEKFSPSRSDSVPEKPCTNRDASVPLYLQTTVTNKGEMDRYVSDSVILHGMCSRSPDGLSMNNDSEGHKSSPFNVVTPVSNIMDTPIFVDVHILEPGLSSLHANMVQFIMCRDSVQLVVPHTKFVVQILFKDIFRIEIERNPTTFKREMSAVQNVREAEYNRIVIHTGVESHREYLLDFRGDSYSDTNDIKLAAKIYMILESVVIPRDLTFMPRPSELYLKTQHELRNSEYFYANTGFMVQNQEIRQESVSSPKGIHEGQCSMMSGDGMYSTSCALYKSPKTLATQAGVQARNPANVSHIINTALQTKGIADDAVRGDTSATDHVGVMDEKAREMLINVVTPAQAAHVVRITGWSPFDNTTYENGAIAEEEDASTVIFPRTSRRTSISDSKMSFIHPAGAGISRANLPNDTSATAAYNFTDAITPIMKQRYQTIMESIDRLASDREEHGSTYREVSQNRRPSPLCHPQTVNFFPGEEMVHTKYDDDQSQHIPQSVPRSQVPVTITQERVTSGIPRPSTRLDCSDTSYNKGNNHLMGIENIDGEFLFDILTDPIPFLKCSTHMGSGNIKKSPSSNTGFLFESKNEKEGGGGGSTTSAMRSRSSVKMWNNENSSTISKSSLKRDSSQVKSESPTGVQFRECSNPLKDLTNWNGVHKLKEDDQSSVLDDESSISQSLQLPLNMIIDRRESRVSIRDPSREKVKLKVSAADLRNGREVLLSAMEDMVQKDHTPDVISHKTANRKQSSSQRESSHINIHKPKSNEYNHPNHHQVYHSVDPSLQGETMSKKILSEDEGPVVFYRGVSPFWEFSQPPFRTDYTSNNVTSPLCHIPKYRLSPMGLNYVGTPSPFRYESTSPRVKPIIKRSSAEGGRVTLITSESINKREDSHISVPPLMLHNTVTDTYKKIPSSTVPSILLTRESPFAPNEKLDTKVFCENPKTCDKTQLPDERTSCTSNVASSLPNQEEMVQSKSVSPLPTAVDDARDSNYRSAIPVRGQTPSESQDCMRGSSKMSINVRVVPISERSSSLVITREPDI